MSSPVQCVYFMSMLCSSSVLVLDSSSFRVHVFSIHSITPILQVRFESCKERESRKQQKMKPNENQKKPSPLLSAPSLHFSAIEC